MFRVPKLAASVYASQQDDFAVMENSSSMDVGEYPGALVGQTYIFTNCDYVKIYKNGEYKSTAYPDRKKYPNLPHSIGIDPRTAVLTSNFIGDALETAEGLDHKSAAALTEALNTAGVRGFLLPPKYYAEVVYAFLHGRMSFQKIYDIVTKYFANWGNEQITYTFEGYKDGQLIKTITRTAVNEISLIAKADSTVLHEGDTYDVTRIELCAVDQNGNRLPFANNAVNIRVDGPAKVIGPSSFALIGGDRAFWVRTTGKKGDIKLTVEAEGMETQVIELSAV